MAMFYFSTTFEFLVHSCLNETRNRQVSQEDVYITRCLEVFRTRMPSVTQLQSRSTHLVKQDP